MDTLNEIGKGLQFGVNNPTAPNQTDVLNEKSFDAPELTFGNEEFSGTNPLEGYKPTEAKDIEEVAEKVDDDHQDNTGKNQLNAKLKGKSKNKLEMAFANGKPFSNTPSFTEEAEFFVKTDKIMRNLALGIYGYTKTTAGTDSIKNLRNTELFDPEKTYPSDVEIKNGLVKEYSYPFGLGAVKGSADFGVKAVWDSGETNPVLSLSAVLPLSMAYSVNDTDPGFAEPRNSNTLEYASNYWLGIRPQITAEWNLPRLSLALSGNESFFIGSGPAWFTTPNEQSNSLRWDNTFAAEIKYRPWPWLETELKENNKLTSIDNLLIFKNVLSSAATYKGLENIDIKLIPFSHSVKYETIGGNYADAYNGRQAISSALELTFHKNIYELALGISRAWWGVFREENNTSAARPLTISAEFSVDL